MRAIAVLIALLLAAVLAVGIMSAVRPALAGLVSAFPVQEARR